MHSRSYILAGIFLGLAVCWLSPSCRRTASSGKGDNTKVLYENKSTLQQRAREIRENTAIQVADGLKIELWATDSLVADPVGIHVGDNGDIYYNRTNRTKTAEFDIRGHRNWMTRSISWQTVEDRRKFLRETFAPEKSAENSWLKDYNGDGSHDWRDLTVHKEEIWKVIDTDGDGIADKAVMTISDFHDEITDVGHGVLVRDKDAFITVAPDLWKLEDTNGDGTWDKKTSLVHGYGVHVGFSGHGMSNPIEGPDGKIYWNIGDIGSHVTTKDGVVHDRSNEGTISRINPDGTGFEVFAGGVRNMHEFVFDEYGNLISCDNDGDHPTERERLVYVVDGMDVGWRTNWQFGKYTDPRNNTYKVWMDERLSVPYWEGQAAYILPPIVNFHNGPTGMQYNPGTALGKKWQNKFFVVEFVGNPARSPIWAFGLKPKGASFELDGDQNIVNGILPTGIRFGPDGALYAADWINGWGTKNYGRIWKIDVTEKENDLKEARAETKRLMQLNYAAQSPGELYQLLFYGDMRIRQKAQFELVRRGAAGEAELLKAIGQRSSQLARIHGIWGIGQLARANISAGKSLLPLLNDSDPEIKAQAAKVIGDENIPGAGPLLIPLLKDGNLRVRFYGAQAIGRVGYREGFQPLLDMLSANKDQDRYLRHAGALALARIGNIPGLAALSGNSDRSLRLAAVLALRRLKSEQIALFLKDSDEFIVTETARAINDDHSIPASLPALAATLNEKRFSSEPLLRRAIGAAQRLGGATQLTDVINFAERKDADPRIRAEALAAIATWANPSETDRVDGRYRGVVKRDPAPVLAAVTPRLAGFLNESDPEILIAALQIPTEYGYTGLNSRLAEMSRSHASPQVRIAALKSLKALHYPSMEALIRESMGDENAEVRAAALGVLEGTELSGQALNDITASIFAKGSLVEQQQLLSLMKQYPLSKTGSILEKLADRLQKNELNRGIALELGEAISASGSEALQKKFASFAQTGDSDSYADLEYGGNGARGRQYFFNNSAGECVRCHVINGQGGEVGPDLSNIGNTLSREQLVQALVSPSARLAPGYGMVMLTLSDGTSAAGILTAEDKEELTLKTAEAEPLHIPAGRITKRDNVPSSMPDMSKIMSRHEIRDVVEFLSTLKK
ncbi:MAG: heme-binding protein [Cytophagaceae bacterium SCN 52-12]|nr:MAG: heme-binding protein [Cytophagaceae bacterium SCN 52-12]